jgi:7-carboxy-7-deazaguanine synthase
VSSGVERNTLQISEIFLSLQGESRSVGWPTTFVRLTGCPLRCSYCDTEYAFQGGEQQTLESILQQVAALGARHVCVTGGEPLVQKAVFPLLQRLCDAGYRVSLETGGMVSIAEVDPRVSRVVDLKTPGSGELEQNHWENLDLLTPQDQLKVVITDRADYDWLLPILREQRLEQRCEVLLSPVHGELEPRQLAQWIVADRLEVRLQLQLHKLLWGEERGR